MHRRWLVTERNANTLSVVSAFPAEPYLSEEEYFMLETESPFRHEYFGGRMYAMAGGSAPHNRIEQNLAGLLVNQLYGRRCESFGPNMKLKLPPRAARDSDYCYPDGMICCDPQDGGEFRGHSWRAKPSALFEVLSASTRSLDEGEKRTDYLALPSLEFYVRIEQTRPEVVVERRTETGWEIERVSGLDATVSLPTLDIQIPLTRLYDRVGFAPQS